MNIKFSQKVLATLILFSLILLLVPALAQAAITLFGETIDCEPKLPASSGGCGFLHFIQLIRAVIGFLVKLAIPLSAVFVVYGGFVIMSAGGSPEKVGQGRKIITAALVGVAILFSSWLLLFTIFQILSPVSSPVLIQIRQALFNR
jgi:hypothetical protein